MVALLLSIIIDQYALSDISETNRSYWKSHLNELIILIKQEK